MSLIPHAGFHAFVPAAVLRVTGEDALSFLQGQFTQELRAEVAPAVAYGLWLNQKGRVLADSFAVRVSDQEVWLFGLTSAAVTIRERLEAYIIADDVVIEDVTGEWRGLALLGPAAVAWLETTAGVALPGPGGFLRMGEGFVFRGRRGVAQSWEWLSPASFPSTTQLPALTGEDLERLRIAAAIPAVPFDVGPTDLPGEGGLEADAISYTKGCYLGQEVMARLKAMGQVRRRLLRVRTASGPLPAVPAPLFQGPKKVGELRSAVADGTGGVVGLALCTLLQLDRSAPLSLSPETPGGFTLWDQA